MVSPVDAGCNRFSELWSLCGPTFLWVIMTYLTIPLTEKSMAKRRGLAQLEAYKADTNNFLPF